MAYWREYCVAPERQMQVYVIAREEERFHLFEMRYISEPESRQKRSVYVKLLGPGSSGLTEIWLRKSPRLT